MQNNSPILIHVPHSSMYIPPEEKKFFLRSDLKPELLKMTDIYCDELFDCGRDMLVFPVSRLVCDVERFRNEADEPMSAKGMGLAYTHCADGSPLRSVSPQKRAALAKKYYDKHHKLFNDAVNEKLRRFGKCVIIDGHSFSAEPLPYEDSTVRPDFCIGTDPFHTPHELQALCVDFLISRGFRTETNIPFSGTIVPLAHLHRDKNVSSVMIEVNRRLYMTPDGKKTEKFAAVKHLLAAMIVEAEKLLFCVEEIKWDGVSSV